MVIRQLVNFVFTYNYNINSIQISPESLHYHIIHMECWMNNFRSLVMLLMIKMLQII